MNLTEIYHYLEPVGIVGIIIVLGSLIKITPLQLNIWGWLARKLGNALNYDALKEIEDIKTKQKEIEKKLDNHIAEEEEANILYNRKSILLFANDILCGRKHTKEQFLNALQQIDEYETYSREHPDFPNNRCLLAIQLIKDNYKERLDKADFLAEEYREKIYKEYNNKKEK